MTTFKIEKAKYVFKGKYASEVFSISKSGDPENYASLKALMKKLEKKFDTYLPLYFQEVGNERYVNLTVRGIGKFQTLTSKNKQSIYDLTVSFNVATVSDTGKKYLNIWADKCKFVEKPVEPRGEELNLDNL